MTNLSALAESAGPAPGVTGPTRKPAGRKPLGIDEVRRSAVRAPAHTRVIGYVTVPPGAGAGAARASSDRIEVACARSGWKLLEVVRDRETGRVLDRPGLRYALDRIANDTANVLVIGELQRLSRSIVDLGALLAWFREVNATLIALDLPIDTSSRVGYQVATTLIALSHWERERIAKRTRNALAEVRANGHPTGRPAVSDRPELLERISAMRASEHEPAGDRGSAQRRTRPDAAGREGVAAFEHPGGTWLPAPGTARPSPLAAEATADVGPGAARSSAVYATGSRGNPPRAHSQARGDGEIDVCTIIRQASGPWRFRVPRAPSSSP